MLLLPDPALTPVCPPQAANTLSAEINNIRSRKHPALVVAWVRNFQLVAAHPSESPLGFCPRAGGGEETPSLPPSLSRGGADSNSIKVPFICRGGRSNRLGRASEAQKARRFAQQLRGPTFAGSCMDSPSVPHHHLLHLLHLLLPQFTHVPASNKCSK